MTTGATTGDLETQRERFPRRTLRRERTRGRILKAAWEQFRQFGYGATTMTAIADAADVHVTTLFTHFKAKRDLAVSLYDSSIERLERLAADARGSQPFFEFFRATALSSARAIEGESGPAMTHWRELLKDPELTFAWFLYEQRQVALLTGYIAHDYGLDPATDYRPELVANMLVMSGWVSHRRWSEAPQGLNLEVETIKALDIAEHMALSILTSTPPRPR